MKLGVCVVDLTYYSLTSFKTISTRQLLDKYDLEVHLLT
jgi:hypothetical protein